VSRSVTVPNFGAPDGLYQQAEVAEPGDPGYPTPALAEADPWASAINQAIAAVEAAREDAYLASDPYADTEPEAEP